MLAEKRYRQAWSADPRNTRWSEDRSKYGYRMLQRMGWSEGDGLGRKGSGRREHVKVTRRCDNAGVGYSRGQDDEWIDHQQSFDQILASLNAENKDDEIMDGPAGGETNSLLSTAIHTGRATYKKRLLSKDLSVASSDDLDCVMGRRRKREVKKRRNEQPSDGVPTVSHGVATITHKMSSQEYFAAKLTTSFVGSTVQSDAGATGVNSEPSEEVMSEGVCGDGGDESDRLELSAMNVEKEDTENHIQPSKNSKKKRRKRKLNRHTLQPSEH